MAVVVEPLPAVLDRRHLHVFVSGPGEGESIAVALPDRGWFLVDGCYVQVDGVDQYPALVAYERWKAVDDPVEALAWTHPHADHFDGIRETIERFPPRRVGVVVAEQPEPGSMCLESAAFAQHPLLPIDVRRSRGERRCG
ncbi:MAG: MBL fold metallo-hydrolase [Myxococcales bacterium]|nr:MBL fold metallo-hydrolase [Myxococcales bacterium]